MQMMMNRLFRFGALAMLVVAAGACEDIQNPVENAGQAIGPWVRFVGATATDTATVNRTPGAAAQALAIFEMPTRVEEDVEVTFSFTGTAQFNTDFRPVDAAGAARPNTTAQGGTVRIPFRLTDVNFPRDTLRIVVPATATPGRMVNVNITGARGVTSGRQIQVDQVAERYRIFRVRVTAP
jgi:hypothetical protein